MLATGLVVDDGIVVTENIFSKYEKGMPIKQAAVEGSKEIFFAVISTSITLAIVFLPVIFLEGFIGRLPRSTPLRQGWTRTRVGARSTPANREPDMSDNGPTGMR